MERAKFTTAPTALTKSADQCLVEPKLRHHTAPAVLLNNPAPRDDTFDSWLRHTRVPFLTPPAQEMLDQLPPTQVGVNIFKCAIGAGSFSLPYAFMKAGLWAGVLITVLLGLLCFYTINLLTDAERIFTRTQCPPGVRLSYPELCRQVFGGWHLNDIFGVRLICLVSTCRYLVLSVRVILICAKRQ